MRELVKLPEFKKLDTDTLVGSFYYTSIYPHSVRGIWNKDGLFVNGEKYRPVPRRLSQLGNFKEFETVSYDVILCKSRAYDWDEYNSPYILDIRGPLIDELPFNKRHSLINNSEIQCKGDWRNIPGVMIDFSKTSKKSFGFTLDYYINDHYGLKPEGWLIRFDDSSPEDVYFIESGKEARDFVNKHKSALTTSIISNTITVFDETDNEEVIIV